LNGGRQIGLGLTGSENRAQPAATNTPNAPPNAPWHRPTSDRPRREPRPHVASPEELERHRAFIAGIDQAIWTR
jgi:DNA polymerase-3 subunit epsilon